MSLEKIREYCLSLPQVTELRRRANAGRLETGRDQEVDQGFLRDGAGEVAEEDSGAAWLTP